MKSKQRVYVYCEADKLEIGTAFAKQHFGDPSNFVVFPTADTELLSHCFYCRITDCPSITGKQNDIGCKAWVGPGSPILALKTTMWKKIQAKKSTIVDGCVYSLNDVRADYKAISEEDCSLDFIAEWSVGCHVICNEKNML